MVYYGLFLSSMFDKFPLEKPTVTEDTRKELFAIIKNTDSSHNAVLEAFAQLHLASKNSIQLSQLIDVTMQSHPDVAKLVLAGMPERYIDKIAPWAVDGCPSPEEQGALA